MFKVVQTICKVSQAICKAAQAIWLGCTGYILPSQKIMPPCVPTYKIVRFQSKLKLDRVWQLYNNSKEIHEF